eukprot:scaffold189237_cov15-Tisochrysis_lutea.AAC.2
MAETECFACLIRHQVYMPLCMASSEDGVSMPLNVKASMKFSQICRHGKGPDRFPDFVRPISPCRHVGRSDGLLLAHQPKPCGHAALASFK